MKKITFLLLFISIFGYAQTPITDANIRTAVDLWVSDPSAATTTYGAISTWDVSQVTDMSLLFGGKRNFNDDISSWDVSSVTDMSCMFCTEDPYGNSFNQDIGAWDVSSVTDMSLMFFGASSFNQNIGSWDVSNVTNMYGMFSSSQFNQDISSWDVSSVTDMGSMFHASVLSTDNYDRLLNSWSEQNLIQNTEFGAQGINYCNGEDGRQKLIDNFGWTITDGGLDCATAGVEDKNLLTISIYPNPTNNTLFISGNETPISISIYNVLGKEVLSIKNTNNINVEGLSSGVYVIRISDGVGQTNRKFIKN